MKKQKSLKLNFMMNSVLIMSSFIFPLITFPYVSRILMPQGLGKVSFATSLISYFNMFASLGVPSYGMRACAKVRDDKEELTRIAQELLIINMFTSFVSYIILAICIFNIPRLQNEKTLYFIMSFSIILTSIGMEWLYKALEQYTYITIRSIILKIISLILLFLLIHEPSDYVKYGAISVMASSASMIFNFINVHNYIGLKPVGNYKFKRHLKPAFVFLAMSCATTIYTNLDTVMLGFMRMDIDVGYYNAAVKIKGILVSIVTSLGAVLLPRSSYYVEHGMMGTFKGISKKAINFVFVLAVPLMMYFIVFAKNSIYFLSGEEFASAIMPMRIIMPTLLFIGLSNILGMQILVPTGREKVVLCSEVAGAITDLFLNIFLIPKYASTGAAIGTMVAEAVVLIVQFIALKDEVKNIFQDIQYIKILLGVMISSMISVRVSGFATSDFMTLLITACIFFMVYGIFLWLTKEPLISDIFEQFIKRVRKHHL